MPFYLREGIYFFATVGPFHGIILAVITKLS